MAEIDVKVWEEKIHSMDNGTPHLSIGAEGHNLQIYQWWENCGLVGESIECSCGFHSIQHPGNGCWQQGHNIPRQHSLDGEHARLLMRGLQEANRQGYRYMEFGELWWLAKFWDTQDWIDRFVRRKVGFNDLKQLLKEEL